MLKKIYIAFALFLFSISLFIGIDRFVHRNSSHFSLNKITSAHKNSSEWEMPALSEEEEELLHSILDQKFTYYSKGSQAYVFISEDKKFILKFLKQNKLRPKSWLAHLPLSFNPYYQEKLFKKKKTLATFNACKTAFVELKNETGLIYVHLNCTNGLNKKLQIFDRQGKSHVVDINHTTFYVQKRAHLIYSRISEVMHHKQIDQAKNIITSVFQLIDFLGRKGIVDNDPILRKNFGLIDDVAVQIDIGKMRIDPLRKENLAHQKEVGSITHSFKKWLNENYPELIEHFDEQLNGIVSFCSVQDKVSLEEKEN